MTTDDAGAPDTTATGSPAANPPADATATGPEATGGAEAAGGAEATGGSEAANAVSGTADSPAAGGATDTAADETANAAASVDRDTASAHEAGSDPNGEAAGGLNNDGASEAANAASSDGEATSGSDGAGATGVTAGEGPSGTSEADAATGETVSSPAGAAGGETTSSPAGAASGETTSSSADAASGETGSDGGQGDSATAGEGAGSAAAEGGSAAGSAAGGTPGSGGGATPTPGRGRPRQQPESEEKARIWDAIEKIRDDGGVVRGRVVEVVKGGLVLDVGVRAFLPASLVEMRRVRDLNPYVGRELEAKVLEMDRGRGNLVLSRRAHLEETRTAGRSTLLAQLQPGQIRRGVISSVVNFGAFVDLGGVDGLISVAELSWTHHNHPSDVVEVGQEVEVEVLDVDQARGRISLSLKATSQDPWPQFARNHPIGQIVSGRVTKLMPFGAFIRVDGLEGLVHVSELADYRVDTPDQVLRTGQEVLVKVTDIDLQRRRISLSIRQANAEYLPDEEQFDPVTYGMLNTYDAEGNYIYPEGFDADTGEWLPGFEEQRDAWERQYAEAHDRWVALGRQVEAAQSGAPAYTAGPPSGGQRGGGRRGGNDRGGNDRGSSHGSGHSNAGRSASEPTTGNEDIDERLAALRERLSDGRNNNRNDS